MMSEQQQSVDSEKMILQIWDFSAFSLFYLSLETYNLDVC